MKRLFLILGCLLCLQYGYSQRSTTFTSQDRLYHEAKTMFDDGNYAGCIDKIIQYKEKGINPVLIEDTDFLFISSNFYQGRRDMSEELKNFMDTHPTSRYLNDVYFMIGSDHFAREEYRQTIYWLNEANTDFLIEKQTDDLHYRLALSYLQTKKYEDASRFFELLKNTSYNDPAAYYLGYIHYVQGDYQKALSAFTPLKNSSEFQPEISYYLNQISFVQGRYSQAINEGKNLIRSYPDNPNNPEISRIIGISYYYEMDYDQASRYMEMYLQNAQAPVTKDYYIAGLSFFNLANYSKAIEYLNLSDPAEDELGQSIYNYLGQSYLNAGNKDKALLSFEAASRLDFSPQIKEVAMYNYAMLLHQNSVSAFGESVTVLEDFLNTYPHSQYSDNVNDALVDVYLTTKNYETALASINKIRNPGNKILTAKQKIYYHLGTVEFTNSLYDKAIENFNNAITMGNYASTEKDQSYYWRGESQYRKEKYNEAIKDYKLYLQSNDRSLRALANYGLGYSYFKQERFSDAQQFFSTYITNKTNNPLMLADAYARLGDCYFYRRNFVEAQKAYANSVAASPSAGDYALFQEGYALGLQKDYQGKINKMDQLIQNYPNSSYIVDALFEKGQSYVMLNNRTNAIDTYKKLIGQFPNNTLARKAGLQIGLLYYNADNSQEAIKAYKDVIARYPGSEETKVALQDLRSIYMELNQVDTYVGFVNSLDGNIKVDATEQDSLTYIAAERIFQSGNYKQAIEGMQKYLQAYPEGAFNTNARYYLGSAYYQEGNYGSAKQELSKVLDRGNNQFTEQTLSYMADIAYKEKDYNSALGFYERLDQNASSKAMKDTAQMGIIRSASELKQSNTVITTANKLLEGSVNPDIMNEILFLRGKAFMNIGEKDKAVKDYEALSKDTRTIYGAEAKYLLAVHYFTSGNNGKAKEIINEYFKSGTPHQYWLAKSFILMSDIYASEGDNMQAKQYLESLKNNYPNSNDDIHTIIQDRLTTLEER